MIADRFPFIAHRTAGFPVMNAPQSQPGGGRPQDRQASRPATRPQSVPSPVPSRTPAQAAAIRRAAAAIVAHDSDEMIDNAFDDLQGEPRESLDGHGWMCSGLGDDQADEIRDLCKRAGMPELAEGFILENLTPADVQLRLIEALAAGRPAAA